MTEQEIIDAAIAKFPPVFGVRAFPHDTFRIDARSSYVSTVDGVMLYVFIRRSDRSWTAFAKTSPDDLRRDLIEPRPELGMQFGRCDYCSTAARVVVAGVQGRGFARRDTIALVCGRHVRKAHSVLANLGYFSVAHELGTRVGAEVK